MNRHELVDVGTIAISSLLLGDSKFFAESIDSPAIGRVVETTQVPTLDSNPFQESTSRSVAVETPVGTFTAAFLPWRWLGGHRPTVIYHHGSGERPFDFGRFSANSFRRLFDSPDAVDDVNLVAIRAPFHDGSNRAYARSMGDLADFVGMLAASVALVEALCHRLADEGVAAITISGISLGGWVTNLHRAAYGTADQYLPIFAGAALGEMFVSSTYRQMTGGLPREHPQQLREVLDFEEAFQQSPSGKCFPLLARYDRIIEIERQRSSYAGMDIAVIEKGHVTGSLATTTLRNWIDRHLARPPARS